MRSPTLSLALLVALTSAGCGPSAPVIEAPRPLPTSPASALSAPSVRPLAIDDDPEYVLVRRPFGRGVVRLSRNQMIR